MRRQERDERRRERLPARTPALASARVNNRTALAQQLGRKRGTVSRWLSDYAQGGLEALLRAARPSGPPNQGGIVLPSDLQGAIRARLSQAHRAKAATWRSGNGHGLSTRWL
jgi:Winged helix-turn helix